MLAFRLHLADRERLRCGDSCACRTSGARGNLGSFPRPLRAGLNHAAPPALVFVLGGRLLLDTGARGRGCESRLLGALPFLGRGKRDHNLSDDVLNRG